MKRLIKLTMVCMTLVMFVSCERVAPNYAGVLMENYGKQGKEDFKIVSGKVSTWELGTGRQTGGWRKWQTLIKM